MEKKRKNITNYKKTIKKNKSNFPLLYNSPNKSDKKRNNGSLTDRNNQLFNSIKESFLKRNYDNYINKMNSKKNYININNSILSKNDLDNVLYKLKKNYNLITTITQKRESEIETLNMTLESEQEKLKKIIDFQEIELPEEKISLKKIGDTKMTKEDLEKHLRDLVNEKRELDTKVFIANQYSKTVEYMLNDEKRKVLNIQEETNQILEKLNNFKIYHNLINDNLNKTKLKDNNYFELNQKLQNDIDLANKIICENNEKNDRNENRITSKEKNMNNLKQKIASLKRLNEEEFEKYTEDIYDKIQKSKEDREEKNKKEKEYIEIIYCLYVLQKFFIEQNNFSYDKLLLSKEYKAIINGDYSISSNNKKEKNSEEDDNKDNLSNYNLKLEELKKIFNEINIKKETIFNYISKLSSRISFNKNCLNNCHLKEISLTEKREKYTQKVKNVIRNDYLMFEELSKNNLKIKSFLEKNDIFIKEIKEKNTKDSIKEINKNLNINDYDKEDKLRINKDNNEKSKEQIIINAKELYKKSNELIIAHNNFLDNISSTLKDIIFTIQNINNNEKNKKEPNDKEFDINQKSKTPEQEFLQKLQDNYQNIINFQNKIKKNIPENSIYFIKYVKELIEFNNNNLKGKLNSNDLNNNLLSLFYKDKNNKNGNIDELFYNHFIPKSNYNQNKIFNHFHKFSNQTHNIIKSLLSLINKNESIIDSYIIKNYNISSIRNNSVHKRISQKNFNNFNNNFDSSMSRLTSQKMQEGTNTPNVEKVNLRKNGLSMTIREKMEENNSLWVEDKETSSDTESIKKEKKIFKRKINFIERNIINNLYRPSFEKSDYLRKLNSNMKNIKNMTLNYCKFNFIMNKKRNEIDMMGNQMLLYNNPKLHPDEISSPVYNNINKIMINKKIYHNKNDQEKRFRSTFTSRKNKYKI